MFTSKIPAIRFTTLEPNGVPKGFEASGVDNFGENSDVLTNGGTEGIWVDFGVWKVVSSVKEQMQCRQGNTAQAGQQRVSITHPAPFKALTQSTVDGFCLDLSPNVQILFL